MLGRSVSAGGLAARGRGAFSLTAVLLLVAIPLCGSLGDPTPGGFVRFDDIRRDTFTALTVQRQLGAPSDATLVVRLNVVGDAADADFSSAASWLARELNVRIVRDPAGAPLYLTYDNLIATSGPAALGATVRSGMAVEMGDDRLAPCVLAHEVLHFLGLPHVPDPRNLMHARCGPNKLDGAHLDDAQRDHVARLQSITAVTPAGVVTWASRAG